MSIIFEVLVFLLVLVVLILVHELGHFIVAKLSGMRVEEFGIGYPPRALTLGKIHETEYTLNWLPFGGFVRIFGEDGSEGADTTGSFSTKPRVLQALTLIAGVVMNLLLAYILICIVLVMGITQPLDQTQIASTKDAAISFVQVVPGQPADKAGIKAGDILKRATIVSPTVAIGYDGANPQGFSALTSQDTQGYPMKLDIIRDGKPLTITATPVKNIIPEEPDRPGFGVVLAAVGTVKVPVTHAPIVGARYTWEAVKGTAGGLYTLFKGLVTFSANLSEVSGPIGIAGAVGQATAHGASTLLSLMALISINLALINLLPIPALDGGRLLFVLIEAVTRKPIRVKVANAINAVGFILLIALMLVVSAHDVFNLFK